jgi:hypothetical protein
MATRLSKRLLAIRSKQQIEPIHLESEPQNLKEVWVIFHEQ